MNSKINYKDEAKKIVKEFISLYQASQRYAEYYKEKELAIASAKNAINFGLLLVDIDSYSEDKAKALWVKLCALSKETHKAYQAI